MEFLYFSFEFAKRHFDENNLIFKIAVVHQHYMDKKPRYVIDFLVKFACFSLRQTLLHCILSMPMSVLSLKRNNPCYM